MLLLCQFSKRWFFSFACAHTNSDSFDFAFELDQDKDSTTRMFVAMIHAAVLQSAMILGYIIEFFKTDLDMFAELFGSL